MAVRLQLVYGDMFDGPTDLVVLPCSTAGTVSPLVEKRLRAFELPSPRRGMKLGDIEILQSNRSLQQLASFVAFAASVEAYNSTLESIDRIAQQLGSFATGNESVLQVSAPLLGAAAGGLRSEDVVERLAQGFMKTGPERATLKIFVLDQIVYERLRASLSRSMGKASEAEVRDKGAFVPICVFISYTRTNEEHSSWVKNLATFLCEKGIDARLDQWDLIPGQDVAQWMCNEIDLADRVLMICNEEYAKRADGRHGGVGWEIRLIQGYLLQESANNPSKFVPIVRTSGCKDLLPAFLRTTYYVCWPPNARENEIELQYKLLEILYKVTEEAPPIGRPPSFIIDALKKKGLSR